MAGYGTEAARDRDMLRYRFFEGHQEKRYRIANPDGSYPVQNAEGGGSITGSWGEEISF